MLRVGPLTIGTLSEWEPGSGLTISWEPTPGTRTKALQAPISTVPIGYMQEQHIRGYCEQKAKALDYSRLMLVSCEKAGRCDVRAANYVINAHLRRHDTFRSWFEYADDGQITRRTIQNADDIEFVPVQHGELTVAQVRDVVANTPDPLQWDCFRFGIVQNEDYFTFFASVDHVHVDAALVGITLMEFHLMYTALVSGGAPLELPPAGKYDDFCIRQREFTSTLTLESPQVRTWRSFAESNDASFPDFPLPLGDPSQPCGADLVTMTMLDRDQTMQFESMCRTAGARFIGGVLACCGLAQHELTGAATYYGLTPRDTRRTPEDSMTQGWFTGLIPVTVPIVGLTFGDAARTAQVSFDSGNHLAEIPYDRIVELVPSLNRPRPNFPVINFLDAGTAPLSVLLTAELGDLNIGVYSDGLYSYQLSIYVIRVEDQTAVTIMFPDNPIAHESVVHYLRVLKSAFERIAEDGHWGDVAQLPSLTNAETEVNSSSIG